MERRINPTTKRIEIKLQPPGLPAIWTDEGYCERCEQFGECLGLAKLSESEWQATLDLVKAANTIGEAKTEIMSAFECNPCV